MSIEIIPSGASAVVTDRHHHNDNYKRDDNCAAVVKDAEADLERSGELHFEPWMTWDNWGLYDVSTWNDEDPATWTWQIDHIIPHSTFQYTSMEDKDFIKCWSLNNLRPYSSKLNSIDGASRIRHKSENI